MRPTLATVRHVSVTEHQPERAVVPQHPSHLAEHADQLGDVLGDAGLQPDLPTVAVVAQAPIGGAGDAAVDALGRQGRQHLATVAVMDGDAHAPTPISGTIDSTSSGSGSL